jgi:hypothetical protein
MSRPPRWRQTFGGRRVAAVAILGLMAVSFAVTGGSQPVSAHQPKPCENRASDSDVEYAGDTDSFCPAGSSSATPTPTPAPTTVVTVAPTASSTGKPTPKPTPKPFPTPTSTSTPSPASSATPSPIGSAGLDGFFAPSFAGGSFCRFSHQNTAIAGNVLSVSYAAGSSAPSAGAPYGGAQICIPFARGPQTSATLTYRVRFPVGFQFVKGGKLPGLYGGVEPFSGGGHNGNGWSMRLMWRAGGAGELYAYIAGVGGYGQDIGRGNFNFLADGQWHTLSEHILLNTSGQSNGSVSLTYNGGTVIAAAGLDITDTHTPISGLFFSTFYGGHDSSWSPSSPQHLDFESFSAR